MKTMISRRSFLKATAAAAVVSALGLTGCGSSGSSAAASSTASSAAGSAVAASEAGQTFKVGIVNYVDHASLNQIVASVESRLDEVGAEKGVTFDYADYYANAQADQSNLNQIGADLVADQVDVIVAVATPTAATMLAAVEDTDIPVVYSAVTDPVSAGFDGEEGITGTSDALNTEAIMNLITAINPDIDTIGLLYDLSQDASTQAIADAKAGISGAKSDYDSTFSVKAKELKKTISGVLDSLNGISGDLDSAVSGLTDASGSLAKGLSKAAKLVNKASDQLGEASDKISAFKDELDSALISGDLATIKTMIGNDPEGLAVSLSGPVALDRKPVYPIRNYGSAMAPFYTILSLWVGSIVLAAMMKVSVDDELINELIPVRLHEIYLGRYLFFGGLALLQATLVCAGDILFFGIQCDNPLQFVLAGWVASLVFSNIVYTLTVSFGDIGKALAVVLLVMQVGGSGGTFPIEMTGPVFQAIYPFLPFTHGINAMHAAMAGAYHMEYWVELGILASYLIPSLALGVVFRRPVIKANDWIIEKLESTKLI